MKCVILAAGYATRLYPLTENFPKPLLKVGEKTIVDWLIDDLYENTSITEYIVVSNHKFIEHFQKWSEDKMIVTNKDKQSNHMNIKVLDDGTVTNETRLGAVKDMELVLDELDIDDDVFVMAGDNVLDFSLKGFVDFAKSKGKSCVMCHKENDIAKQRKTAIISFDETNKITSYEEKPQTPKSNFAVPPFYVYTKKDYMRIKEAIADGCNKDAPGSFAAWLSSKAEMYAYEMPGKRYDIGDVASYSGVQLSFNNKT